MDRQNIPITAETLTKFIGLLREMPNVTRAARLLGHSPQAFRYRKSNDPEFSTAWDEALEEALDNAEAMVHRRAFQGADKVLTYQGHITYLQDFGAIDPATGEHYPPHEAPLLRDAAGRLVPSTVKEYSDQLAMFMLKAHRPDKYRERSDVNVTGSIDIATSILAARKRSGG